MKYPIRRSIAVVADGPSAEVLRYTSLPQRIHVLAVNHASIWLPRCNSYMTCFPDARQRFLMNNQRQGVRYFAAVPPTYGSAFSKGDMFGPREKNVTFLDRVDRAEIQTHSERCAGGNSVFAALDLANKMQAERVAIFGLDGNNEVRVSGGRPGLPKGLPALFDAYSGGAKVVNASINSAVTAFPKMSVSEAIGWLL